jgi:uncharacterized protein YfiM (DUF2279 family)
MIPNLVSGSHMAGSPQWLSKEKIKSLNSFVFLRSFGCALGHGQNLNRTPQWRIRFVFYLALIFNTKNAL